MVFNVLAPFIGVLPRFLSVAPFAASVAALVLKWKTDKKFPPLFWPGIFWMAGLAALMAVTCLWSVDRAYSFNSTIKTLPVLIGSALLLSATRLEDGALFRKYFPFAAIAGMALCVLELYSRGFFYFMFHAAAKPGTEDNLFYLNRGISMMTLMVPVLVTCVRVSDWPTYIKNGLFALTAVLLTAMLYRTDSQSAQMAFILMLVFYFLFPTRIKAAWVVLWAVLAAGLLAAPWVAQEMFHVLPSLLKHDALAQRSYALNRMEVWDFVSRRALQRPFTGHGVEAARLITDYDTQLLYQDTRSIMHPHNFVIQLWIVFGVWGPLYAAGLFGAILNGARKLQPLHARTALAVMFGCISVASTGYGLWQGMWLGAYGMLFCFCALAAADKKAG